MLGKGKLWWGGVWYGMGGYGMVLGQANVFGITISSNAIALHMNVTTLNGTNLTGVAIWFFRNS